MSPANWSGGVDPLDLLIGLSIGDIGAGLAGIQKWAPTLAGKNNQLCRCQFLPVMVKRLEINWQRQDRGEVSERGKVLLPTTVTLEREKSWPVKVLV